MARSSAAATAAEPVANAPTLTLTEFCRRTSETDRRTELLAAFFSDESRAGRLKDTAEAYAARLQEFLNKPA